VSRRSDHLRPQGSYFHVDDAIEVGEAHAGATIRIAFRDARKGVCQLDVTDAEAEALGGRSVARRGRRPRAAAS
jgi:hypothetical protein